MQRARGQWTRGWMGSTPSLWRGFALAGVMIMLVTAGDLSAQIRLGGQGSYQTGLFGGSFGGGGRISIGLPFVQDIALLGTYDKLLPDCPDCTNNQATLGLLLTRGAGAYLGAGATYKRFQGGEGTNVIARTEDWSAHFLIGLTLAGVPFLTPFGELRYELGSGISNQAVISAGVYLGGTPQRPR